MKIASGIIIMTVKKAQFVLQANLACGLLTLTHGQASRVGSSH
jgi:hypothetical protein